MGSYWKAQLRKFKFPDDPPVENTHKSQFVTKEQAKHAPQALCHTCTKLIPVLSSPAEAKPGKKYSSAARLSPTHTDPNRAQANYETLHSNLVNENLLSFS